MTTNSVIEEIITDAIRRCQDKETHETSRPERPLEIMGAHAALEEVIREQLAARPHKAYLILTEMEETGLPMQVESGEIKSVVDLVVNVAKESPKIFIDKIIAGVPDYNGLIDRRIAIHEKE